MTRPPESAAEKVVRAWQEPGPYPGYHRLWKDRLRRRWPSLADAIQELVDEHEQKDSRG